MVDMLGPVSTWEDHGVERSGTLPSDWYTSPELYDLEQRTLFREVWHVRRPRRPGGRARPVLHVRGRRTSRSSSRAAATASCARCRTSACTAAARSRSAAAAARRSSARTTAGRSSSTAASAEPRAWTARRTSIPARCACRSSRSASGGRPSGSPSSPRVSLETWLADVTPAPRELPHGRDALRRRTPLGDRLQLEALRRQLHGGLPHPLHPPGPRPEPQPDRLHLPARASTRTSSTAPSRTRAAPARASPGSLAARRSCAP